jgi:hypothetical protein
MSNPLTTLDNDLTITGNVIIDGNLTVEGTGGGGSPPGGSAYSIQYQLTASSFGGTGPGTSGQVLTSNGLSSAPTFQNAGSGSGTVTSVGLSLAANSFFTVSGSPVTTSGTLTVTPAATKGDLPYASATNTISNLAIGTTGQILSVSAGGIPSWTTSGGGTGTVTSVGLAFAANSFYTISGSPVTTTGTLTVTPAATKGDLPYASATNTIANLAIGSTGQVLTVASGLPSWATVSGTGTVTSVALSMPTNSFFTVSGSPVTTSGTLTITPAATKGDLPYASATNTIANLAIGTTGQTLTVSAGGIPSWTTASGSGTVTSVAATGDGVVLASTVTGSPITTSGTLALSLANAAAYTILANSTASAAAPTYANGRIGFGSQNTTGTLTAASPSFIVCNPSGAITVTLPVASTCLGKEITIFDGAAAVGDTVQILTQASDVIHRTSGNTVTTYQIQPGTSLTVMANGTNSWYSMQGGGVPDFLNVTLAGGSVVYGTSSNQAGAAFSAAGTTGQVLISGGTGSPTWTNSPTLIHQVSGGTAPTVAAGAGAGSSPTIAIAGHDTDFSITLTTGTTPTGTNAVIATVTFGTAYATAPYFQITSANANAASLMTALLATYGTSTTTTFVLNSGTTGLVAATQYIWNVHCGQ